MKRREEEKQRWKKLLLDRFTEHRSSALGLLGSRTTEIHRSSDFPQAGSIYWSSSSLLFGGCEARTRLLSLYLIPLDERRCCCCYEIPLLVLVLLVLLVFLVGGRRGVRRV